MTLSVYGRKTHEVLMMTYMILIVWLMFPGLAAIPACLLYPCCMVNAPIAIWFLVALFNRDVVAAFKANAAA